jgi:putative transposase
MDEAENDVLVHMSFPEEHWQQSYSTNPLERPNGEIKRRTDLVAIFPNEPAIVRLGPCCSSRTTSGPVQRRYMNLETLEGLSDDPRAKPRRIAAA